MIRDCDLSRQLVAASLSKAPVPSLDVTRALDPIWPAHRVADAERQWVSCHPDERAERRALEEEAKKVSRELASVVEREINGLELALAVLATSDSLQRQDFERFDVKARKIAMAFPETLIALRDLDGHVVLNTYQPHGAVLPRTIDPVLLETDRRALAAGRMVVSGVYTGAVTHVPFVSVEQAIGLASGPHFLSIAVAAEHFR